jgi:uridylate kinase
MSSSLKYKRILLKLSGEALSGDEKHGINPEILNGISGEIKEVLDLGAEISIVVGAGNFFRGSLGEKLGIDRAAGDYMGMLATVMNSIALKNSLEKIGIKARVLSAIEMKEAAEPYIIDKARSYLSKGDVVIAAAGTGHPFFTTDTAASLRAVEMQADILVKATRVDGVFTSDPEKDPSAKKFDTISFKDVLNNNLRIMDLTAISLCMENTLPILVFNLFNRGSLKKIVLGEKVGTFIS